MSYFGSTDWKDTALICENGHIINSAMDSNPERNTKYCKKCGAIGLSKCKNCGANIEGKTHIDGMVYMGKFKVPKYCHECGKAYPWTINEMEAAKELIKLTDLTENEKAEFINSLDDISVEGPRNKVGVTKVKMFLEKIGNGLREDVKEVVTNIAVRAISEQFKGM